MADPWRPGDDGEAAVAARRITSSEGGAALKDPGDPLEPKRPEEDDVDPLEWTKGILYYSAASPASLDLEKRLGSFSEITAVNARNIPLHDRPAWLRGTPTVVDTATLKVYEGTEAVKWCEAWLQGQLLPASLAPAALDQTSSAGTAPAGALLASRGTGQQGGFPLADFETCLSSRDLAADYSDKPPSSAKKRRPISWRGEATSALLGRADRYDENYTAYDECSASGLSLSEMMQRRAAQERREGTRPLPLDGEAVTDGPARLGNTV